jgi:hypothetical protein
MGHVQYTENGTNTYNVLVAKYEGKRPVKTLGVNLNIILKLILKKNE